jgi:hypothetical protein
MEKGWRKDGEKIEKEWSKDGERMNTNGERME